MENKKTGLELLRQPFPLHQISKLPKPTKAQTDAVKADYKKAKADWSELKKKIYKCDAEKMTDIEAGEIQRAKEQLEESMTRIN